MCDLNCSIASNGGVEISVLVLLGLVASVAEPVPSAFSAVLTSALGSLP